MMHLPIETAPPMSRYDIAAYSPDHRQVLIVEVKSGKDSAPHQLERIRQALMSGSDQNVQFFVLAQRNGLFLWKKGAGAGTTAEFASVRSVLNDYAASLPDQEESIRKPGLEIVIHAWLDDLALGIRQPKPDSEADQLLVRIGAYTQIKAGRIVAECGS